MLATLSTLQRTNFLVSFSEVREAKRLFLEERKNTYRGWGRRSSRASSCARLSLSSRQPRLELKQSKIEDIPVLLTNTDTHVVRLEVIDYPEGRRPGVEDGVEGGHYQGGQSPRPVPLPPLHLETSTGILRPPEIFPSISCLNFPLIDFKEVYINMFLSGGILPEAGSRGCHSVTSSHKTVNGNK